jgi:C4-dicarboxylate-specific signal transduction histidine kinase
MTLKRWKVSIPVGSIWIAAPGPAGEQAWLVAPVRSRPASPPPGGRERRSRERLALELAGLAVACIEGQGQAASPTGAMVHQATNPLTAARAGLQLAMESIGRWEDLAADRRSTLLDELAEVLGDIDRTSEYLRVMKESARSGAMTARGERGGRFDAVRIIRSCLTLEGRLLRDRGLELEFTTDLETVYLKGNPNALFDMLVSLVRHAADPVADKTGAGVRVQLAQKGKELELVVRGRGRADVAKARSVAEGVFGGTVSLDSLAGDETTLTIALPLPPQREGEGNRGG